MFEHGTFFEVPSEKSPAFLFLLDLNLSGDPSLSSLGCRELEHLARGGSTSRTNYLFFLQINQVQWKKCVWHMMHYLIKLVKMTTWQKWWWGCLNFGALSSWSMWCKMCKEINMRGGEKSILREINELVSKIWQILINGSEKSILMNEKNTCWWIMNWFWLNDHCGYIQKLRWLRRCYDWFCWWCNHHIQPPPLQVALWWEKISDVGKIEKSICQLTCGQQHSQCTLSKYWKTANWSPSKCSILTITIFIGTMRHMGWV